MQGSRSRWWRSIAMVSSALAHHSPAMFDTQKIMTLQGSDQSQFQWTNPHSYVQLLVKGWQERSGVEVLQMGAPMYAITVAGGRRPRKQGDTVTVTIGALRSGKPGVCSSMPPWPMAASWVDQERIK